MFVFTQFLKNIDFVQSKYNNSLFIKKTGFSFNTLLVYMDDTILVRNCMPDINIVKYYKSSF